MNLDFVLDNAPELLAIATAIGGLTYILLRKRQQWLADGKITLDEVLDDVGGIAEDIKETVADVKENLDKIEENEEEEKDVASTE